jgi:hypothetical protein
VGRRGGAGLNLLTARELAERWRVRAETVLRWTRQGKVTGVRLPSGALRYRVEDVEAFEAARETGRARGEEVRATHPLRPTQGAMLAERATPKEE